MPSSSYDIGYLKAGVESLESYLLSIALFWPIHESSPAGEREYSRLTLGNLLLSNKRLEIRELTPDINNRFRSIYLEINKIRNQWRSAWERKANEEIKSRIRQWNYYLQDLRENPEKHEVYYPNEVRIRVIITLLSSEVEPLEEIYQDAIDEMDAFLKKIFIPGSFQWEQDLESGMDKETFWYLWGVPKIEETLSG